MTHLGDWADRLLAELAGRDLLRELRIVERVRGPYLTLGGREVIGFASNDYLGLSQDPRPARAAAQAAAEFGWGAGASRLVTGTTSWHAKLERRLAGFAGRPAALSFVSGSAANAGLLGAVGGRDAVFASDELNHASVVDACRLSRARIAVYPHRDVQAAERLLREAAEPRKFVVTDGVFSMDGDLAPLAELQAACVRQGADLLVDDAHGFGVLGESGRGSTELAGVEPAAVVANLAKAGGASGGFVLGPAGLIGVLVNRARSLMFTTAPPAAEAAAGLAALEALADAREARRRVLSLSDRLRSGVSALGYDVRGSRSPIIPVVLGTPAAALKEAARLYERGCFVPAIRPPAVPPGQARLRISLTALHEERHVDELLDALKAGG